MPAVIAFFDQDGRLAELKAVLDALPLAVILLDRTVAVRLVNAPAENLLKHRAELRIVGPTLQVRRSDENIGFEETIRSVFTTGNSASYTFFSRAGVAELTIDMRLAEKVDLVLGVVTVVTRDIKLVTVSALVPASSG